MAPGRLSYHDVLLYPEDIALLKGSHWINDQIISFWFEYLSKEKYPHLNDSVALIGGATAFLLCQLGPAEAGAVLGPLNLSSKSFILAAVNDSKSPEVAQAGQHWSLLAWDGADQTFRHFDSHAPHNHRAARKLADALAAMLGYKKTSFLEASSRQQDNGYDCGVCVMANADILCSNLLDATLEHPWEGLQEDARAFKNTRVRQNLRLKRAVVRVLADRASFTLEPLRVMKGTQLEFNRLGEQCSIGASSLRMEALGVVPL